MISKIQTEASRKKIVLLFNIYKNSISNVKKGQVKRVNYKTTTIRDLINDAKERDFEATNTLKELVSTTTVDKDGKEYGLSH